MDCEKCRELLTEYIDGRLSVDMVAALAAHLEDCPACREIERELRATVSLVAGLDERQPPDGFAEGIRDRLERRILLDGPIERPARRLLPWSLSGAALAAAALILVAFYIWNPPDAGPLAPDGETFSVTTDADRDRARTTTVASADKEGRLLRDETDLGFAARDLEKKDLKTAALAEEAAGNALCSGDVCPAPPRPTDAAGGLSEVAVPLAAPEVFKYEAGAALARTEKGGEGGIPVDELDVKPPALDVTDAEKMESIFYFDDEAAAPQVAEDASEAVLRHSRLRMAQEVQKLDAPKDKAQIAPVEEAPSELPAVARKKEVPVITFHVESGALAGAVIFADSFPQRMADRRSGETSPENIREVLSELGVRVIELQDEKTVLQADLQNDRVISLNKALRKADGVTLHGELPPAVAALQAAASQVVRGRVEESDVTLYAKEEASKAVVPAEKLLTLRYVFIRPLPPAPPSPASPQDAR